MTEQAKLHAVPDVDIDVGTFKYIQIKVETSTGAGKVIIRGTGEAEYHADIYEIVAPGIEGLGLDTRPVAGGRIVHKPDERYLKVYGYSMGYGQADHKVTAEILRRKYPDYQIETSNEGY